MLYGIPSTLAEVAARSVPALGSVTQPSNGSGGMTQDTGSLVHAANGNLVLRVSRDSGAASVACVDPNSSDRKGRTSVHTAAKAGGTDAITALPAAGADPNMRDNYGYVPVHDAASAPQPEAIAALLAGGADPNARDRYGRTALHLAVWWSLRPFSKGRQAPSIAAPRRHGLAPILVLCSVS